jgi:hypothetical protein
MSIPFIGRRYTTAGFDAYVKGMNPQNAAWWGKYPVLHHTASPSLAMRPDGLTDQHLENLLDYYQNKLGWSGAPHLFVDDRTDGIIVFQRLDRRGVHAKSFNADGWGIEMLGDFDVEDPTTGRGLKVVTNACHAAKTLLAANGSRADALKFHRDDLKTDKSCPGTKINKSKIMQMVASLTLPQSRPQTSETVSVQVEPEDQSPSSWAEVPMGWVESEDLMGGNPRGVMTREMMATVLHRYHQKFGSK